MSNWKIIVPEHTRNYCLNPSMDLAANYAALGVGPAAITRYEQGGAFGHVCLDVNCAANNEGISFTLAALPAAPSNEIAYVTVYVKDTNANLAGHWDWSLDNVNYHEPAYIMNFGGPPGARILLYGYQFSAAEANGSTLLYIRQNGAVNIRFIVHGVMVESGNSYWTTMVTGDLPGCAWDETPYASSSRRSSSTRTGGRMLDLEDDYYFNISGMQGAGSGEHDISTSDYALLPGGEIKNDKLQSRNFALAGSIIGSSWSDYHDKRSDLIAALTSQAHADDSRGPQAVRLWYTGQDRVLFTDAYFEGGMEARLHAQRDPCYFERNIALRFFAPNPIWYEAVFHSFTLDAGDTFAIRGAFAKLYSIPDSTPTTRQGTYDELSIGALGGNDTIYTIAIGPDHHVYVGGDFTNLDGIPVADYIAEYNPYTDTWSALGAGRNNIVWGLAFGPDGTLYAVGDFTDLGTEWVASWNGAAWATVGNPDAAGSTMNNVYCVEIDQSGNVWVGGNFTQLANVPNADYAAYWDGAAWNAPDANALNASVRSIALAPNGDLYLGGNFTQFGAVASSANYIVQYDTSASAYVQLGSGSGASNNGVGGGGASVETVAVDRVGNVYLGGQFTTAMGDTANRIAMWNGSAFEALGSGVGATVRAIEIGPDDVVWVGGAFTTMSDLARVTYMARWHRGSWAGCDWDCANPLEVRAIALGDPDPVITANYDIFIGVTNENTLYCCGSVAMPTDRLGTYRCYPSIHMEWQSGGTYAHVVSVRNVMTGDEINLDYPLQLGEKLSIYLEPTKKRVLSSFYGERPDAVLPNSDFGSWSLLSRSIAADYTQWSTVTAFVESDGGTIPAWVQYHRAFEGLDSD